MDTRFSKRKSPKSSLDKVTFEQRYTRSPAYEINPLTNESVMISVEKAWQDYQKKWQSIDSKRKEYGLGAKQDRN